MYNHLISDISNIYVYLLGQLKLWKETWKNNLIMKIYFPLRKNVQEKIKVKQLKGNIIQLSTFHSLTHFFTIKIFHTVHFVKTECGHPLKNET